MRRTLRARRIKHPMVARKWLRLAQAVAAELGGNSPVRSLSQAPDDVLLRASERCGLLLARQFHRPEDRPVAIRRHLDEVRDAGHSPASPSDEDEDTAIRRGLREIAFRDTTTAGPTALRATTDALRTLAGLNRASRQRDDREKFICRQRQSRFRLRSSHILPASRSTMW